MDLRIFELKCRHKVGKRFIISHYYCHIIAGMFFITKDLKLAQVFDLDNPKKTDDADWDAISNAVYPSRIIDGLVYKPFLVKVSRKEEKDGAKARV
jgi:hypothetical protein